MRSARAASILPASIELLRYALIGFSLLYRLSYTVSHDAGNNSGRFGAGERGLTLRKWFILFGVLILVVLGVLWWLGGEVENSMPENGEVRMETGNVF